MGGAGGISKYHDLMYDIVNTLRMDGNILSFPAFRYF